MISTSDILNATILIVDDLQANLRLLENTTAAAFWRYWTSKNKRANSRLTTSWNKRSGRCG
jgi:hypothetical protein